MSRQPRGAAGGEDQARWTPGMGFQKQMQASQRTSFPGLDLYRVDFSVDHSQAIHAIALLFLLERQWRGMIAGGAVLAALSAGAFWWTGVSPMDFFAASPATE